MHRAGNPLHALPVPAMQGSAMRGWYVRAPQAKVALANGENGPVMRIVIALMLATFAAPALARDGLPAGFVYLRDVEPSIAQDMRYASSDNFTGHPLPGYDAAECVLRRDVAEALSQVQADLAGANLSLKVYDCYRPTRAVRAMAAWSHDGARESATKRFFPTLEKRNLFALGYIAAQSAHSTGTAVDLTLVPRPAASAPPFDPAARYGPCTGPAAARAPDASLDMGTGFDCFDDNSHTGSGAIDAEQRRARATLLAAMRRHGFKNYFREWWHFSFGPQPAQGYDVPIGPRTAR
jgi:D-alanyl-D-alanine dipeptidase